MPFPFDVTELLRSTLAAGQRPPDGKLHPSSHLTGSLRHMQLGAAGAPTVDRDLVADVNLAVGTSIHTLFENGVFRGKPVMLEVKLDAYMPAGWSGTADWIAWDAERRCFVLGDLKTSKPGAINYILRGGAKDSHIWQVSSYWWALARMGLPLAQEAHVYYVPKGQLLAREGAPVQPTMQEIVPLPQEVVEGEMVRRREIADAYLESIPGSGNYPGMYLTDELAPVQDRVIRTYVNKALKRPAIDVKLEPHWSTAYCDFPSELCNCREQKANKIGQWDRDDSGQLVYTPIKGAPQPATLDRPDPYDVAALVKAQREKEKA